MFFEYTLMILAALFGLAYTIRSKSSFARIITWIFVGATIVRLVTVPQIAIDGVYLFAGAEILVIVYGFSSIDFTLSKKMNIAFMGIFGLAPLLLLLLHFFDVLAFGVLGLISLILFGYILVADLKNYKDEIGFLAILAADALIHVVGLVSIL